MTVAHHDTPATAGTVDRFGLAALRGGVPVAVWSLTALHAFVLLAWSITVPIYRAPDEPHHVDMTRVAASPGGWPDYDERFVSGQVHASMVAAGFSAPEAPGDRLVQPLQAGDAVPRGARPGFDELGPATPSDRANQLAQHPPLHYLVTAVPVMTVTAVLPIDWAHDQTVWLMRAVSVALAAPLPLLAFATARRLAGPGPVSVAAAAVPLAVPQLSHIGSSVNNDVLLVLLVGLLTVALVYVATGDTSRRTAAAVGVLGAAALLTKGFALFLPVWVAAAYVVAAARGAGWRHAARPAALALAVAGAGGGWWWLRNLVRYGTVQPSAIEPDVAAVQPDVWLFLETLASRLSQRYWSAFGWDELHLAWWVVWAATGVAAAGVALAVAFRPAGARWWRADLLVALLPVVCISGIVTYGAWDWYTTTGALAGIQGRYLFPGVAGAAAVVALGLAVPLRGLARFLPVAVFTAAVALQAAGAYAALTYFWGPGVLVDLRVSLATLWVWSPWPAPVLAVVVAGLVVSAAASAAALVRSGARPPAAPGAAPAVVPEPVLDRRA